MITTRYSQTNFPTLPWYDASHPHVHLIDLDANNLYGLAMSQPLPTDGFRFLQPDEIEALAPVGELSDDAEDGYMTLTTTTHWPRSCWRSVVICIHPLSMQSFHHLHLNGNSLLI